MQIAFKQIVTKQLNLDDKKFEPRSVRYAISNAKIRAFHPKTLKGTTKLSWAGDCRIYDHYQNALAANNALDFDDLILVPVRLFQQNEQVLGYWYQKFHHIW